MMTDVRQQVFWPEADEAARERLRAHLNGVVDVRGCGPDEAAYDVRGEEPALLVAGRPTERWLDALRPGDALVIPFAGVPAVTRERLRARPWIRVGNLHDNAPAVAESALALALAAARGIVQGDAALRRGDWRQRYAPDGSVLLQGGTALLVGFGAIGRALAPMLQGLSMRVRALRRRAATAAVEDDVEVLPATQLRAALPDADLVVLCAPLTEETRGCIDAAALATLRPTALLVNVGRAELVDEDALYEALVGQRIHAAALDVWWQEPVAESQRAATPPSRRPFDELSNVVMSPHRAAHWRGRASTREQALAAWIRAWRDGGGAPPAAVDVERGY